MKVGIDHLGSFVGRAIWAGKLEVTGGTGGTCWIGGLNLASQRIKGRPLAQLRSIGRAVGAAAGAATVGAHIVGTAAEERLFSGIVGGIGDDIMGTVGRRAGLDDLAPAIIEAPAGHGGRAVVTLDGIGLATGQAWPGRRTPDGIDILDGEQVAAFAWGDHPGLATKRIILITGRLIVGVRAALKPFAKAIGSATPQRVGAGGLAQRIGHLGDMGRIGGRVVAVTGAE